MDSRLEDRRLWLATALVIALVLAMGPMFAMSPALATDVDPVLVEGNPSCGDLTDGGTEFKIEGDEELQDDDSDTYTDGTLIVELTIYLTEDGWEFDWETNFGVDVVVAKGGPNANAYFYSPIATSDTGLHSPLNPSTGEWYGLSHISFCYFPENATTTTTEESTTTTAAVSDEEESTTTTAAVSDEEESTTTTTEAPEEETTTTTAAVSSEEETTTTTASATTTTTAAVSSEEETATTTTIEDEVLGTVVTSTTVQDDAEVSPSTLPFTGVESEHVALLALALLGGGAIVLVGARSIQGRHEN